MKAGPEKALVERYFERFARAAPPLGLEWGGVIETVEGRARDVEGRRREEAGVLETACRPGSTLFLLDERGRDLSSPQLAARVRTLRDEGCRDLMMAIGGPDGHDPRLREKANFVIAFGAATWPHQMVRVMLAEQLYRTATILSGHPYHRA